MAVYTPVSRADLENLLSEFAIGTLVSFHGAADGIENTTYFFTTDDRGSRRDFVLSIIEVGNPGQISFSSSLTTVLNDAGLPVPCPVRDIDGNVLKSYDGKSVLVFPRISGQHLVTVKPADCAIIGDFMARAHIAGRSLHLEHFNQRGVAWLNDAVGSLVNQLSTGDRALLREQAQRFHRISDTCPDLPVGCIHGDLFRDNALFRDDRLVAVIDYYNACEDWLLLDVAIAINDWCSDSDGEIERELAKPMLESYHRIRAFTRCERQYWQDMLCFAATRFWVSRLLVRLRPDLLETRFRQKDPNEFRDKLEHRMIYFPHLPCST